MVLFECCNIFAYFSQKSSAKVQKIFEIHKCFSNYFGDKCTHAFLPLRLTIGPSLRTPSPCPTDQESAHVGKIAKNRQRKLKTRNKVFGVILGVEPREGLREGSKSPLPHYEPSIYGPFSHIEGEREGKNESQLILGFRHTGNQPKSGNVIYNI